MLIKVTQEHINQSHLRGCDNERDLGWNSTPIKHAVREALPNARSIMVWWDDCIEVQIDLMHSADRKLPESAKAWLRNWFNGCPTAPFEFEIGDIT